jgi:N-carbamoyl-L-amino-acid hydrolase
MRVKAPCRSRADGAWAGSLCRPVVRGYPRLLADGSFAPLVGAAKRRGMTAGRNREDGLATNGTSPAPGAQFALELFETVRAMSADTNGVSRPSYGDVESRVLDHLRGVAGSLGLAAEFDPAGNLWMRRPGRDRGAAALVTGSHADSVPRGGNYDGLAGIVAGLVVARRLHDEARETLRDYAVLALRAEESAWFGKPYLGSAALLGRLTEADLALKHRDTGFPLAFYMREAGAEPARLALGRPLVDPARIAAFVELHIEQGPTLDEAQAPVGIVTGIRGNVRHLQVRCLGEAGHSGAVPKRLRHDPVLATADLFSRIEEAWQEWLRDGHDLVFTAGVVQTNPATHAVSVIPGEVAFSLEARSLARATIEDFHTAIRAECDAIGRARGVRFEFDPPIVSEPAVLDAGLTRRLARAADAAGLSYMRLASGAGHDAALFANAGIPTGMIFVRNQNGSHNPQEAMRTEDFMAGCELLWRLVVDFEEDARE